MLFASRLKRSLIVIGCALVMALPFLSYNLGWFSLVSVVPIIFLLDNLAKLKETDKAKIWQIYGLGLAYFAIVLIWMRNIQATKLIANSWLAAIFLIVTYLWIIGTLALGFWLIGYIFVKYKLDPKEPKFIIMFSLVWAASEFLRSLLFSIATIGPDATIGPHWNFGVLGFAASVTPLAFGARLVGLYGLSVLVLLVNLAIFLLLKRRFKIALILLGTVILTCGLGFVVYRAESKTIKVGAVSLSAATEMGSYQAELDQKILTPQNGKLDALVLPEYSHFFEGQSEDNLSSAKATTLRVVPGGVIISSRSSVSSTGSHANTVTYYDPDARILGETKKRFLIPGGEFVPYVYAYIMYVSGNHQILYDFNATNKVTSARVDELPFEFRGQKYGALACSGAIAPEFYRMITARGATVLSNSASIASLGVSDMYYQQSKQMARFQAVANSRPFIQSARGGYSYIFTGNGKLVVQSRENAIDYVSASVQPGSTKTIYTLIGEWIAWIGLGLVIYLILVIQRSSGWVVYIRTRLRKAINWIQ